MTVRADPALLPEIKEYGAFDINACFNCGNCTAVCPLSKEDDAFPRRMIRYAQLGLTDHLVGSREVWLCHYCGECTTTCPREADPGGFMASARRYAISRLDPTPLSRWMHLYPGRAATVMLITAIALMWALLFRSPGLPEGRFSTARMLDYIPYEVIHWSGIFVMTFVGVMSLITVVNLVWRLTHEPRAAGAPAADESPGPFPLSSAIAAFRLALSEVFGHESFRTCDDDGEAQPLLLRPWFVHFSIMAGFFGLLAATTLDYAFKDPDVHVPIWAPIRLLGTLAGILFVYGTTTAIVRRFKQTDPSTERSSFADWVFLLLLWATGVSGFVIEIAIYLDIAGGTILYGFFLLHIVLALELLLLLPFSKFAHSIYRPLALLIHGFRRARLVH